MRDGLEEQIDRLESLVLKLDQRVASLDAQIRLHLKRYVTTCPACKKVFDLLVNHYSIGLFDNLVHVKCPHCNKSMPVVDGEDGGIRVVLD